MWVRRSYSNDMKFLSSTGTAKVEFAAALEEELATTSTFPDFLEYLLLFLSRRRRDNYQVRKVHRWKKVSHSQTGSEGPHPLKTTNQRTMKLQRTPLKGKDLRWSIVVLLDHNDVCKCCLRHRHKADQCRHQLTCWRYSYAGHFAVRCPLKSPTNNATKHKKERILSKKFSSSDRPTMIKPLLSIPTIKVFNSSYRISLPISEASSSPNKNSKEWWF